MLKEFFANLKLKRQVNKEFKKFYKEQKSITIADRLAKKSCKWVELLWNGEKQKFLIHVINYQELLCCGRFDNVLLSFIKGVEKNITNEKLSEDDFKDIDLKRLKEEQEEFLIELAERSMVMPTYRECYDAILKLRGMENGSTINDVIPKDFLYNLQLWYINSWSEQLKKNLAKFNLKDLAGSQNTGEKHQANTLKA